MPYCKHEFILDGESIVDKKYKIKLICKKCGYRTYKLLDYITRLE